MHRSSESVAGLATALAKAQIELINPEKSLTAIIRNEKRGEANQSFRYAPLASGLDIIRKTLGRHEIAVMQTTAVDTANGLVNLTTLLAHTSGDWISSDWPVCSIADIATPHRMGAALTYARRYALFALVGIAGDDDLDAPNLNIANGTAVHSGSSSEIQQLKKNGPNGTAVGNATIHWRDKQPAVNTRQPILSPNESAELRTQLLAEITDLSSADAATNWALHALGIKNQLTSADAQAVEEAFSFRLTTISAEAGVDQSNIVPSSNVSAGVMPMEPAPHLVNPHNVASSKSGSVDKHVLVFGAPPRRRDKTHLRYVATQACLVCGRQPSDPHHLRFAQPRALGRKVSDEFTVPLCRSHHREVHHARNESKWWNGFGIDPMAIAGGLWNETHGLTQSVGSPSGVASPNASENRHSNGADVKPAARRAKSTVNKKDHDVAKTD